MKALMISAMLLFSVIGSIDAQNHNALGWRQNTAYNSYLMREVHRQFADREARLHQAFSSPAEVKHYIAGAKKSLGKLMGTFPQPQPLHAKVTGIIRGDKFNVEKVIFESVPGRYVTAHLYMPNDIAKPVAASLELCGHGQQGKWPPSHAAMWMASNGIAVMVVDPIAQGERLQLIDDSGNSLVRGVTTEHTLLNPAYNLLGTSLAAQEYWDNHCAIDYLCSRSDIDSERIGVYGSSGGGTQTAYMLGMDERIKVAAICSFFSTRERTLELQGPSDGCQHIPYEGKEQIEVTDLALMMAPRPLLILSGKYDFVDLWGAQQGFAELKEAYTVLSCPEKVDMLTVETGHGLGMEKQHKLIGWFKRWLNKDKSAVKAIGKFSFPQDERFCSPFGQVNKMKEAKSEMKLNHETYLRLKSERDLFLQKGNAAIKKKMMELLGITQPDHKITIEQTGFDSLRFYNEYHFQVIRTGEMPVPCVLLISENVNPNATVNIVLDDKGKSTFLNIYKNIAPYLSNGSILLAADFRGMGEMLDPPFYSDAKYWNFEYRNSMTSMHIGRPIMGQRVIDLLTLLDFCSQSKYTQGREVNVKANGLYGPVALHATFIDHRIAHTEISQSIKSWDEYIVNPLQRDMYSNVIYNVLHFYDLKDLAKLCKSRIHYTD